MRVRRHPTDAALVAWLSGTATGRVARHVDGCDRCLAALERLSDLDADVVAGLGAVVAAPTGIEDRTVSGVERRMRDEDALLTFFELFTTGWATTKVVLDLEEGSDG